MMKILTGFIKPNSGDFLVDELTVHKPDELSVKSKIRLFARA